MARENKNTYSKTTGVRTNGTVAFRNLSTAQKTFWSQSEEHKKLFMEVADELFDLSELKRDFCSVVQQYIKLRGYNRVTFCKLTLLSEKYFKRIMENQIQRPTREAVMSICAGLNLWGSLGEELFEAAGYKMNMEMLEYKKILHLFKGRNIVECDEALQMLGLPSIVKA